MPCFGIVQVNSFCPPVVTSHLGKNHQILELKKILSIGLQEQQESMRNIPTSHKKQAYV